MSDSESADVRPKKGGKKLPPMIEELKTRVIVDRKSVRNTKTIDAADAFKTLGVDNSFDFKEFTENFRINISASSEEHTIFDVVGIDAPIANAFRRILISEVPTVAIEKVVLFQNTSVIQDEVLAHRIGLLPIKADPRKFKYVSESRGQQNEDNTLIFVLDVHCTRNKGVPVTAPPEQQFKHATVFSRDLKWIPQGAQAERFTGAELIRPVYDDIVVAKMRPGQSIEAELWCEKGVGKTHAKFSPVATASYRLLPEITFTKPIKDDLADELVAKCPMNVFDIEELADGSRKAVAARPRNCSMCRECVREDDWSQRVQLKRVRDHFIYSIESTGAYPAPELFPEALKIFIAKCKNLLAELKKQVDVSSSGEESAEAAAASAPSASKDARAAEDEDEEMVDAEDDGSEQGGDDD